MTNTCVLDSTIYPLPVHPVWGRALAVLDGQPVWPVAGGADDDEGPEIDLEDPGNDAGGSGDSGRRDFLDDEPDDDEPGDAEPDDKPADDWKPPTKEEWQRTQKALNEANKQAEIERRKLRELRQQQRQAQPKPEEGTVDAARAEAAAAAEARLKPIAIRAAAKAALLEANFQQPTDARVKKLIKRLDFDDIEVDEEGEITGLQTQIDQLVDDFPELFTSPAAPATTPTPKPKPRGKLNPAGKKDTEPTFATTGDRIAARVRGEA